MPLDRFSQTLQAAAPPTSSPLGDFPELRSYFASSYQLPAVSAQVGQGTIAANVQRANTQAQEDYGKRLKAAELQEQAQKLKDNAEGKNWRQVPKADGGYDFLDGMGNKVSIFKFAQATGSDPTKLLAGSSNPLDIQHNSDFSKVQSVANALLQNDNASLQKIGIQIYGDNSKAPDDPVNVKAIERVTKLKKQKPADLIGAFMSFYPHIYGQQSNPYVKGPETLRGAGTLPGVD